MSFRAMFEKEVADLVREKRFGIWALVFLAFWTIFLFAWFGQTAGPSAVHRRDSPMSPLMLSEAVFFFYALSFVVLSLFMLSDGVTKERESGMLPIVGAKPIVRWHVPLAKLAVGAVVYVASFVVSLLPLGLLAFNVGMPALEMMLRLYVGPFLALYAVLLGLGLVFGVVATSTKVAIGGSAALTIPMFFMTGGGPFQQLYYAYPTLQAISEWSPFDIAMRGVRAVAHGGAPPWGGYAACGIAAAALVSVAFWAFARQEMAQ